MENTFLLENKLVNRITRRFINYGKKVVYIIKNCIIGFNLNKYM